MSARCYKQNQKEELNKFSYKELNKLSIKELRNY